MSDLTRIQRLKYQESPGMFLHREGGLTTSARYGNCKECAYCGYYWWNPNSPKMVEDMLRNMELYPHQSTIEGLWGYGGLTICRRSLAQWIKAKKPSLHGAFL